MDWTDFCERLVESCVLDLPGPWVIAYANRSPDRPRDLWSHRIYPSVRGAIRDCIASYGNVRDLKSGGWTLDRPRWQERENIRFADRTYVQPVWIGEMFWRNRGSELIAHYAHVSTEAPGMIAFTESAEKGELDRQTRTKAGRYLKRFFGDVLTDKQVAFYAEWQTRGSKPKADIGKLDLKFASTPDEIEDVYTRGPASCMQASDSVRVYGAGDLAIAYLEAPEGEHTTGPEIAARVLVWPEKKAMGRIYPNVGDWSADGFASESESQAAYDMLHDRLKADGYRSFYEEDGLFDGARLLRLTNGGGDVIMPYIDKLMYDGPGADGFYRLSDSGRWSADNTNGLADGEDDRPTCENCDSEYDEGDGCRVMDGDGDHITICPRCHDRETWYCDYDGESYMDSVANVTVNGSESWTEDQFSEHGFTCQYDGDAYSNRHASAAFPGFHKQYDEDADAHPELDESDDEGPDAEERSTLALVAAE